MFTRMDGQGDNGDPALKTITVDYDNDKSNPHQSHLAQQTRLNSSLDNEPSGLRKLMLVQNSLNSSSPLSLPAMMKPLTRKPAVSRQPQTPAPPYLLFAPVRDDNGGGYYAWTGLNLAAHGGKINYWCPLKRFSGHQYKKTLLYCRR